MTVIRYVLLLLCCGLTGAAWAQACTQAYTRGHGLLPGQLQNLDFDRYRNKAEIQTNLDGTRLGEVRYYRQNVFPHKSHWLARQANRYNTLTRERALRQAFPLASGEVLSTQKVQEAERILRAKPYLYDAAVMVRQICGGRVDLDVVVRDVWTLTPGVGVSRSGGDNETSVSLSDVNVLGSGKSISVAFFDDRDRAGASVSYTDPNLLGSRWAGRVVGIDNDDGERYGLSLVRPFFSLDSTYSLGVSVDHFEREQDLEFLGEDEFELQAETDQLAVFAARSGGRRNGWVNRYFVGARYVQEEFEFPVDFPGAPETRRRFTYPYVGWQLVQDSFVEQSDVDRVGITEDIKLGWSSYVELGWSPDELSSDGDVLLWQGSAAWRRLYNGRHLLSFSTRAAGRYDLDNSRAEDVQWRLQATYHWQQAQKWRLFSSARYQHTKNLPLDKQLTLGGDSGLRGYPSRYQPGDRSFLVTLEQRYYSDATPFGLLRLGYAAFVDSGRAWFHDSAPDWVPARDGDHFGQLTNVGVGLRLESIRTRRDRVFHLDIARPLVDGPFVDTWEISLSGRQRF